MSDDYCNEMYCSRDFGQEEDGEGVWWCGECGYETYNWAVGDDD